MKEADIRKYAALMKELELTGLEITEDNKVVRLERAQIQTVKEPVAITLQEKAPQETPLVQQNAETDDRSIVCSPLVGVFYSAPAENAEPYVSIGDRVEKGQVLCIVEAMKLMNEITAEQSGVIEKICVTNGKVVEYGTELFHIRRTV